MPSRARHCNGPIAIGDTREEAKEYLRSLLPAINNNTAIYQPFDSSDRDLYGAILSYIHQGHPIGIQGVLVPSILNAIAYRVRMQSKALATFLTLAKADFISSRGLQSPVRFSGRDTENRSATICLLKCFDWFWRTNGQSHVSIPGGYDLAVVWLATMLKRGQRVTDLPSLMILICHLQTLGDPNTNVLASRFPRGTCQVRPGPNFDNKICFWLPHNLGREVDLRVVYERFDREYRRFEGLFSRFFGYSMMESPPHRKHRPRAGDGLMTRGV